MHCSWSEARFERRLDNALAPGERLQFDAHLAGCDACRGVFDELRIVDAVLRHPATSQPGDDFTRDTMRELERIPPPPPHTPFPWIATLGAYLIAAWMTLGAAYLLDPAPTLDVGRTLLTLARGVAVAIGGVAHAAFHLGDRGELSTWTTYVGGIVVLDLGLAVALVWVRRRLPVGENS